MTASKKRRYKEHALKREPGGYVPMPHAVLRSAEFAELSPRAVKLLCDLLAGYRGDNNGDLCAALSLMKTRGWRSKEGLAGSLGELEAKRFIIRTRQGGRHKASLYGVTFFAFDWCSGKLDIDAPSRKFLGSWRNAENDSPAPPVGQSLRVSPAPPVGQIPDDCPADGAKVVLTSPNCPAGRPSQGDFRVSSAPPPGTFIELPLGAADGLRRYCDSC